MAGINVGGCQTISGSTSQHGEYKGHGIGARSQGYPGGSSGPTPLPGPVISELLAAPAPAPVPAPAVTQSPQQFNQYYYNYGTSIIEGNTKQDGTFKGHGIGASVQGGFTASGDIN